MARNRLNFTAYTDEDNKKLRGIWPIHITAYNIFRFSRFVGILLLVISLLTFGFTFISGPMQTVTSTSIYRKAVAVIFLIAIIAFLLCLFLWLVFLRKPPFDEWVFEVAQKRLGTETIFYTSKCLYISYDIAAAKEVDKRDFVTEMSDKSDHYSYFYVETFPDEQVLQIECTKRQPIPERASFSPSDDKFWNILPIGLTINNITQKISPIGWWLNDQNKDEEMVPTVPSTSILIAGGTGSGKSVLEQSIVGHVSRYPDRFQLVGVKNLRIFIEPDYSGV